MKLKCLVADDRDSNLTSFVMLLESCGHTVIKATDQPSAIRMIREHVFDFILTDNDMPMHNDGMEVVRQARIIQPNALVWMATGRFDFSIRDQAMALGADECYDKMEVVNELLKLSTHPKFVAKS